MRIASTLSAILVLAAWPLSALENITPHTVRLTGNESPAKVSLSEMAWLTGRWVGNGLGGRTVETWSAPEAGVMLGTFRLLRDEKTVFYELLTLGENERGLTMRLKHFHPDLTGWEEKEKVIEFRYVRTEGKLVQFEGLTFRRDGEDDLTIFLALRGKDGGVREETFRMQRN
jgi:hypothetical protein